MQFYDSHILSVILFTPLVGALLLEPVDKSCAAGVIFFNNVGYVGMCGHGTIGLAATLTIIIMPFTYSITNGIGFGFITYTVICAARREWKRIHPVMWIVTAAFVLYFLVPYLQQNVSWFGGHL